MATGCFGSQAALFSDLTRTAASGGKADLPKWSIIETAQTTRRVSAFLNSGHSDLENQRSLSGCFRPEANVRNVR
jgi:hypothetical protein